MKLNPSDGPDFINVYIDDIIVFSRTWEDHLQHLRLLMSRLEEVGLKLKPSKCHFAKREVEYLGFMVTPEGLKPTQRHTSSISSYPVPINLKELRQFLGLASYYRRFIQGFAAIAHPLHQLTRKDTPFNWTSACQQAFERLKSYLTSAPVLAYPDFSRDFILETDACVLGLGAILSQRQEDGSIHPIAYASRSLSQPEKNYGITELETLAVVWAFSHFRAYLYGHKVTVYTDHSAVKAILGTPNLSGKHARWWTKVYSNGVNSLQIIHLSGKENVNADALSRNSLAQPAEDQLGPCQVAALTTQESLAEVSDNLEDIQALLNLEPDVPTDLTSFSTEQRKDSQLVEIIQFLTQGMLPSDESRARKVALQAPLFAVIQDTLYFLDKPDTTRTEAAIPRRVAVPKH